MFVGEIYPTNNCGDCEVLEIFNSRNVTVRFITTGYVKHGVVARNLDVGSVKDPYYKSVYGVGFIGEGCHVVSKNRVHTVAYSRWCDMLRRCYSELWFHKNPSYRGCSVCSSWHNFQSFADWWVENEPECEDLSMYDLDKDMIVKFNKIYSPETCSIVRKEINVEYSTSFKNFTLIISPEGVRWPVKNVSKFCRGHGLDFSALSKVINRKLKQHKGWRLA